MQRVIGVAGAMGRGGDDGRGRTTSLWKVHVALLVAQVLSGGYYVVTKVALLHGMNRIVLSLYRDLVALVFLLPAALFIERLAPQILQHVLFFLVLISVRRRLGPTKFLRVPPQLKKITWLNRLSTKF